MATQLSSSLFNSLGISPEVFNSIALLLFNIDLFFFAPSLNILPYFLEKRSALFFYFSYSPSLSEQLSSLKFYLLLDFFALSEDESSSPVFANFFNYRGLLVLNFFIPSRLRGLSSIASILNCYAISRISLSSNESDL